YFMGTKALMAERDALLARKTDDFVEPRIAQLGKELELWKVNRRVEALKDRKDAGLFIEDIAKMRGDIAHLESLRSGLDLNQMRLVRVDQPAVDPLAPISPKRALIVALGLILGGMLGVFAALLRGVLHGGVRRYAME